MFFSLSTLKLMVTQLPMLFSFLREFISPPETTDKKSPGVLVILLLGLGLVLWYTVHNTAALVEASTKDKAKIGELTKTLGAVTISLSQVTSAKERREDKIEMLEAQLKSTDGAYDRLNSENTRLYNEKARLEGLLNTCKSRTFTCEPYKPSLDLLVELESILEN